MSREDDVSREADVLREKLSKLSEAILRINDSLDFDTVLQGVLDSARALTGARYGVISTITQGGGLDSIMTSGTTDEEHRQLVELAGGMTIFEHFKDIAGPMWVDNFYEYAASVGIVDWLPITVWRCLVAPIRYHGRQVGTVYLAHGGEDEEFTEEDEDTLRIFASQAAMVMTNARRHQEALQARAHLEVLIETSPVGVAVFDGRTGDPVPLNREAVRIMDELRTPGHPLEHLLEVMTVRRSDGREVSLEELSVAEALSTGETVRAEEVVFQVPDGRRVTAVVNATPIWSKESAVEFFVVTLQDMTTLEEGERLRAEFLAMVSHELRTPLAAVRGSVTALLDETSDMHPAEARQFHRIILEQTDRMRALITDLLDVARIETGELRVSPEPTDLAVLAGDAANSFHIGGNRHEIDIGMPPDLPWVMADRSRIAQVLGNLLTNAARHSPESSTIRVSAVPGEFLVSVSVSDEGRGIPAESLPRLFGKFSRIDGEDQDGDTGLGLAVCKGIVEAHGGRIWAESDGPGLGARFTFTLPTVEEAGFVSMAPVPVLSNRASRRWVREQVRILAVDDDVQALRYIRDALETSGFAAIVTSNPNDVLRIIEEEKPHLVLLDLMLPGFDGIELMRDIMAVRDVPVIFVSAYGQDRLIARAFEMGADDYVVKPFSATELEARIRAALRRRTTSEPAVPYIFGDLTVDYGGRLVSLAGNPVSLTAMQYRLLVELSISAGRVLTYEHLLRQVWGLDGDADVRPIRTAISAIRRALGDDAENPMYVFTELRVGYRMPRPDVPP